MELYEKIKKFWQEAGLKEVDKDGLRSTARDPYMQQLNEYFIGNYLGDSDQVLDVGCGDGSSTDFFSQQVNEITGIDYSQSLIERALQRSICNGDFIQGDVLELDKVFEPNSFDRVISIRCLINLPDAKMQYRALENLFYVLKPGGLLLFSEGYKHGWDGINIYRQRNGLSVMNVVEYNLFFDNLDLEGFFQSRGEVIEFIGFGEYIYGSRVIHPLLTNGNVQHDSHINRVFAELQIKNTPSRNCSECSYAGVYVVKKDE